MKQFDLVAVAKEIYSDGSDFTFLRHVCAAVMSDMMYWSMCVCLSAGGCILSVAVVKNRSLDIRSLRGSRSCHSGARWTAGWSLPLGFLLSRNYLSWSKEHPLSQGEWDCDSSLYFFSSVIWFFSLRLVFLLSGRRQYLFQCQLYSRSLCHGTSSVYSVPRPEVLHPPEELPLRNFPQ